MSLQNLDQNIYENEVIGSGQPALLCFIKNTIAHSETVISLEALSQQFAAVQFYAAQEEEHEFFFELFHFGGTPLFIFLANGIERGRLLGAVSTDRLRTFIEGNLSKLKPQRRLHLQEKSA